MTLDELEVPMLGEIFLDFLRALERGALSAAQRRRRGGRLAFASPAQRGESMLVLRSTRRRAPRDDGDRLSRLLRELEERGMLYTRPRDLAAGKAGAT